jgi:site-specific DNA-methyltransferase (adenine-specific)
MFSFVGDTVLDPFCGTATTMVAALKTRRNSIGIELDTEYCRMAASRLMNENGSLFSHATIQIELQPLAGVAPAAPACALQEKPAPYKLSKTAKNGKRPGKHIAARTREDQK